MTVTHPGRGRVKIVLACGDQITARNPPLNSVTKYGCEARKGHGYSVGWVSYTNDSGFTRCNPRLTADGQVVEK